jgi:triosephosphate isomerase (TIM)
MEKKLLIANWKMNKLPSEEISFIENNIGKLQESLSQSDYNLVICPTFLTISQIENKTEPPIFIGAQNVSEHSSGSHTGQVSAKGLAELGCSYAIVGHSEDRLENSTSNKSVAQKVFQLFEEKVVPIVCIGETAEEKNSNKGQEALKAQLAPVIEKTTDENIFIAYEPIYAIGTGVVPSNEYLKEIFNFLGTQTANLSNSRLLYGGSVDSGNMELLNKICKIDGYLIGKASLDFKELQKMITFKSPL